MSAAMQGYLDLVLCRYKCVLIFYTAIFAYVSVLLYLLPFVPGPLCVGRVRAMIFGGNDLHILT